MTGTARIRHNVAAACVVLLAGCVSAFPTGRAPGHLELPALRRVVHYQGSNDILENPERGLYASLTAMGVGASTRPLTGTRLRALRSRGITLVRVYFVIDEFRDLPLSQATLQQVQADFDTVREAGLKVIPRFTYNFPMTELATDFSKVEDARVDRVLEHIDQLAPVLSANSDVIAFLEAGFIGAWGEWHHSSNGLLSPDGAANEASRLILERLLSAVPATRTIAIRYPYIKQQLFGRAPLTPDVGLTTLPQARVGAHNDCFLRDRVDSGTYSRPGQYRTSATFIDEQKRYLEHDNRFVPQGGETCAADEIAEPFIECATALRDLARLRWSTINADYHPGVVRVWRRGGCLDDIRKQLGYRLRLQSAALPTRAAAGSSVSFSFEIVNEGWAAPFNPRLVEVVLRHAVTGHVHTIRADEDPRTWLPGRPRRFVVTGQLPPDLQPGSYDLYLHLPDPEPRLYGRADYSIRLANRDLWQPAWGFNALRSQLAVEAPDDSGV